MFTNTHYFLKILITFLLVVGFCFYGNLQLSGKFPSYEHYLSNPELNHKKEILKTVQKIVKIYPSAFVIREKGKDILVKTENPLVNNFKKGMVIDFIACFNKEGYFELQRYYIRHWIRVSIFVSFLAVLLVVVLFLKYFEMEIREYKIFKIKKLNA